MGIMIILCISQFVIGIVSINNCPINQNIPVWLLTSGIFGVFTAVIIIFNNAVMTHLYEIIIKIFSFIIYF